MRSSRVLSSTGTPKPRRAIQSPGRRAVMRGPASIIAAGFTSTCRKVIRAEKETSSVPTITGRSNGRLPWR